MNYTFLLIPATSAFVGWFVLWIAAKLLFYPQQPIGVLGSTLQGIVPKHKKDIDQHLGRMALDELLPYLGDLEKKVTDPANINKMMPFVEGHIDHFLRVKLAEKMPVISMFIGEKTISELKTVFIDELQVLFPVLMKNYMAGLQTDLDIERAIADKISSLTTSLSTIFKVSVTKWIMRASIFGAGFGFVIGLLQLLLIMTIK